MFENCQNLIILLIRLLSKNCSFSPEHNCLKIVAYKTDSVYLIIHTCAWEGKGMMFPSLREDTPPRQFSTSLIRYIHCFESLLEGEVGKDLLKFTSPSKIFSFPPSPSMKNFHVQVWSYEKCTSSLFLKDFSDLWKEIFWCELIILLTNILYRR